MIRALHPEDRARVEAAIDAALRRGTYECEYRAVRPDGTRGLDHRARPRAAARRRHGRKDRRREPRRQRAAAGRAGARAAARQRTARRATRPSVRAASRTSSSRRLSHELRTPMNAILGLAQHARAAARPCATPRKAIAVIQRNAQMQAKLIEDLLEMNKLTSGTVAPGGRRSSTSRRRSTARCRRCSRRPTQRACASSAAIDPAVPQITADARRLQQMLWNLLHNAVKFTPDAGPRRRRVTPDRARRCRFASPTPARASRPTSCRTCSIASARPTPQPRAGPGGWGSGCPLRSTSWSCTAAPSMATSGGPGQGATFIVQLPRPARLATASGGNAEVSGHHTACARRTARSPFRAPG